MENCLVTTLKATINNDDLLKMGEYKVVVKDTLTILDTADVRSIKDSVVTDLTNDDYSATAGTIAIKLMYGGLVDISANTMDRAVVTGLDLLKYYSLSKVRFVLCDVTSMPLSEFAKIGATIYMFSNSAVYGSLIDMAEIPNETTQLWFPNTKANGELADLFDAFATNGKNNTLDYYTGYGQTLNGTAIANSTRLTVRFGTSMVNPTPEETAQGWQIA